jgi:hypothetical protein
VVLPAGVLGGEVREFVSNGVLLVGMGLVAAVAVGMGLVVAVAVGM